MTSHLVVVFISSAITFTIFFMIDGAADRIHGRFSRGLRSLGKAFMLLLGLAWEGAFWEGAHSMAVGAGCQAPMTSPVSQSRSASSERLFFFAAASAERPSAQ